MKSNVNDSTAPSKTENIVHALTGLCLSLPSQAHISLHMEKVVEWIKTNTALLGGVLSDKSDEDDAIQSENVVMSCNLALACASIELIHSPNQLKQIIDMLMQQLPVTKQSAIALGVVTRALCTTNANAEDEDKTEKGIILSINDGISSTLQNDKTMDWRQVMHLIIGQSIVCDSLLRIGQQDQVTKLFEQTVTYLKSHKINDDAYMSHCLALPNVALALLHHQLLPVARFDELVAIYKDIAEKTETSSLPVYTRTYRNACIGLGSLLFGVLCETRHLIKKKVTKEGFSLETYNSHVLEIIQRLNDNQNNTNVAMGAILSLAAAFGVELIVPEHFSKVEEDEELHEWGLTSRTAQSASPLSSLTHRTMFKNLLTSQDPNDENAIDDNRQKSQLGDLVMRGLQVIKQIFSSTTITDVRVRRYGALVLGVLSDIYNPSAKESQTEETIDIANVSGNAERIPLQFLNEDGLSMYLIKIVLDQNSKLDDIETALQVLLTTPNLPSIHWSGALQQIMRATNQVENTENIRIKCIRLLCKEARMGSTQSLKLVSSLCEPKHFFALDRSLQNEIVTTETFSLLLSIFPLSRSFVFLIDLFDKCNDAEYALMLAKGLAIAFDASKSLIYTAMDRNVLILFVKHVQKILKQFVSQLSKNVITLGKESQKVHINHVEMTILKALGQVLSEIYMYTGIDDHYRRRHERAIQKAQQKQLQVNLGAPTLFLNDVLSLENKNIVNMTLCILIQGENMKIIEKKTVQSDIGNDMSVLRPVRDLCVDSNANVQVVNLFSGMIAELLMRKEMEAANCKKWVQDTLDVLSFLLSENLSQESTSTFQLDNALTFMAHNICVWSACDVYLGLFGHDMILHSTTNQDLYINNVSRLLVHVLSKAFLDNKLSQDVERALMTRLYSILQIAKRSETDALTYSFVLPLLIHIRGKKLVKKSWVQIGSCLERTAMRVIKNIK
jgi:hypothetical protein